MSLPKSYPEVARLAGLTYATVDMIEMSDKRVTRSGIRRYLMAAAAGYVLPPDEAPQWYRLWLRIRWTRTTARTKVHVTIPPELWAEDKARLAAKIAATTDIRFKEERERALRWTRR